MWGRGLAQNTYKAVYKYLLDLWKLYKIIQKFSYVFTSTLRLKRNLHFFTDIVY
jgi:hypothetical protein